jgi:hypothetical protein
MDMDRVDLRVPLVLKEAAKEKAWRDRTTVSAQVVKMMAEWVSADEDLAERLRKAADPS